MTVAATAAFTGITVLRRSAMSVTASACRYGHKWFLKSVPGGSDDVMGCERLKKEFEILSGLRHFGILQAVSIEPVDGLGLSMVCEWIDGASLEHLFADSKPDRSRRRQLAADIVAAVAFIHSAGIVHRDLKPANIMIRKLGGFPVLVDFGLADTGSHTLLKQAGGTRGYMSPEAAEGQPADTRDDVYSLGVILRQLRVGYGSIIRKCLAPAGKRYRDAVELQAALRRRGAWHRPAIIAAAGVVLAAVIAGAAGLMVDLDRLERRHRQDAAAMTVLNDSLGRVAEREQAVTRHNQQLKQAIDNGLKCMEAVIAKYDSNGIAALESQGIDEVQTASMASLELSNTLTEYLDGLQHTIDPEDFMTIRKELWEREAHIYYDWSRRQN